MKKNLRKNGTICDKVGHDEAASPNVHRNGAPKNRIESGGTLDDSELGVDDLTPDKANAIVALISGCTVSEAAVSVGVSRKTVHRWMKHDSTFCAILNHGRQELLDSLQARLMVIAQDAADCVERAVLSGDGRTAIQLLKDLGFLDKRGTSAGAG